LLAERGWKHRTTSADTPTMNGVIERNAGYVYLAANTMLEASCLPTRLKELYWPHAVSMANLVRNHMPNSKGKVPQIDAHGHGVISLRKLHPFGTPSGIMCRRSVVSKVTRLLLKVSISGRVHWPQSTSCT